MWHLGSRVSALLDGQLSPEEAERAWAHVHACHACRDLVEREGWIKTRLAGLSHGATAAPDHLKGSLLGPHAHAHHLDVLGRRSRSWAGLAIGGGAVGVAVLGVLALGTAPSDGPVDRRAPVTNIGQSDSPRTPAPTSPGPRRLMR
jgi:predicted anti-sigma-YlaC factor YlaD